MSRQEERIRTAKEQYEELFSDVDKKAMAFDKMAERFYYLNFGTMSKTDFDTLMFSLYLDQLLNQSEGDLNSYSDYTLSKVLGISQSRIKNLKVRKEMLYPYDGFDWKKSFERVALKAHYEDGKVTIDLRDVNLFYEIKNAIEENGGYVDIQFNPTLLKTDFANYFALLSVIYTDDEKDIIKALKQSNEENKQVVEKYEKLSGPEFFRKVIKEIGPEAIKLIHFSGASFVGKLIDVILKQF